MSPLSNLFPETDGLSRALRAQSRAIGPKQRAVKKCSLSTDPEWNRVIGVMTFQNRKHDPHITAADCRQTKPSQEDARQSAPATVIGVDPGAPGGSRSATVTSDPESSRA